MKFDLSNRDTIFASLPKGGVGAEIGVDAGIFSEAILRLANPRLLCLVDSWAHLPKTTTGSDPANYDQATKDAFYREVYQKFLHDGRVRVLRAFSLDAAQLFRDSTFDWVFIDANHLQCYQDIQAWWRTVRPGGWIIGHDYVTGGVADFVTVQADVDRWVAETGLPLLLTDDKIWKCWLVEKPL